MGLSTTLEQDSGVGLAKTGLPNIVPAKSINFNYNPEVLVDVNQRGRQEGFVRPTGGVHGNGPYEFVLPAVSDAYLMMGNLYTQLTFKFLDEDDTDIDNDADELAMINFPHQSMWQHIEVQLNDRAVSGPGSSNSNYKAYLETLLSYGVTAEKSHLYGCQLFQLDPPGKFDDMKIDTNNVYYSRLVGNSNLIETVGPICADFLKVGAHLPPNNKLSIKFHRAPDPFLIVTPKQNKYKIVITDFKLHYHRVRLADSIPPPRDPLYLGVRTELKKFPIPAGIQQYEVNLHHAGRMPKQVILAQALTSAVEGDYRKNPYNFQHFNLSQLYLKVNGRVMPGEPLKPIWQGFEANRSYAHLFMNTGGYKVDRGNLITREHFVGGCAIFPFDLNPDMCNGFHLHLSETGEITADFSWATPLALPITILAYLCYDEAIVHDSKTGAINHTTI